ncbi:ATP-binding cassette domain-containing protein [Desulfobotulus sp. H1]|uniref:ATP-binding cassette domain-containing protein n=1 Tax=Desulfobotulus pelophilus TaxID=2823377 RepID=A0ABT3NAM5_9BACT|nr:ATP-binding cassette domain-containing protein [Desulfobotulus pelophilus]MCW7754022.1 ATP-binding cassette domain-containing protein [Desulfobotulus pelophilus]
MADFSKNLIVRMFDVYKAYGKTSALKGVSLEIAAGDIVFITGPSGAGKSTLLKLLYKAELASQGQILVDGLNLSRIGARQLPELRRRIGVIFQDFKLIAGRSVFDNVALVLEAAGEKPKMIEKKVMSVLRTAGIEEKARVFPPSLSGGEQQRVAVSRAVVGSPRLILADEPTASLDPQSAEQVMQLLETFHGKGATLVIATHNRRMISRLKGREIRLEGGAVGVPEDFSGEKAEEC